MIDFIMKTNDDGVVFKAQSDKARDWCMSALQAMADPIYSEEDADGMRILFERMDFEVANHCNVIDIEEHRLV